MRLTLLAGALLAALTLAACQLPTAVTVQAACEYRTAYYRSPTGQLDSVVVVTSASRCPS